MKFFLALRLSGKYTTLAKHDYANFISQSLPLFRGDLSCVDSLVLANSTIVANTIVWIKSGHFCALGTLA